MLLIFKASYVKNITHTRYPGLFNVSSPPHCIVL